MCHRSQAACSLSSRLHPPTLLLPTGDHASLAPVPAVLIESPCRRCPTHIKATSTSKRRLNNLPFDLRFCPSSQSSLLFAFVLSKSQQCFTIVHTDLSIAIFYFEPAYISSFSRRDPLPGIAIMPYPIPIIIGTTIAAVGSVYCFKKVSRRAGLCPHADCLSSFTTPISRPSSRRS